MLSTAVLSVALGGSSSPFSSIGGVFFWVQILGAGIDPAGIVCWPSASEKLQRQSEWTAEEDEQTVHRQFGGGSERGGAAAIASRERRRKRQLGPGQTGRLCLYRLPRTEHRRSSH